MTAQIAEQLLCVIGVAGAAAADASAACECDDADVGRRGACDAAQGGACLVRVPGRVERSDCIGEGLRRIREVRDAQILVELRQVGRGVTDARGRAQSLRELEHVAEPVARFA